MIIYRMTDPCSYYEMKTFLALKGEPMPIVFDECPCGVGDTIQRYFELGLSPGSMVTNVLSGRCFDAYDRCHPDIKNNIGDLIVWVRTNLPRYCYGTTEIVNEWIARGGLLPSDDWDCPWVFHRFEWSRHNNITLF